MAWPLLYSVEALKLMVSVSGCSDIVTCFCPISGCSTPCRRCCTACSSIISCCSWRETAGGSGGRRGAGCSTGLGIGDGWCCITPRLPACVWVTDSGVPWNAVMKLSAACWIFTLFCVEVAYSTTNSANNNVIKSA